MLRRVLRRASRYGRQTLNAPPGFLAELVPVVAQSLGEAFPEVREKLAYVQAIIADEERSFAALLERGIKYFNEQIQSMDSSTSARRVVSGETAFFMYDTLGFPIDLTQIMAAEKGLEVDVAGFQAAMAAQQERGRRAERSRRLAGRVDLQLGPSEIAVLQKARALPATDDSSKYAWDVVCETSVDAVVSEKGELVDEIVLTADSTVGVVLRASSFYPESGGQISDTGTLLVRSSDGSSFELDVISVRVSSIRRVYLLYTSLP